MVSAQSPAGVNIARSPQNGLGRLAAWCYDHRRRVLLGWLLAVVAVIGLAQWAGSRLDNYFARAAAWSTPGRSAQRSQSDLGDPCRRRRRSRGSRSGIHSRCDQGA